MRNGLIAALVCVPIRKGLITVLMILGLLYIAQGVMIWHVTGNHRGLGFSNIHLGCALVVISTLIEIFCVALRKFRGNVSYRIHAEVDPPMFILTHKRGNISPEF